MSSRRPLSAFVVALAAGAQVVAGLGAGPTWWQVIGGTAAVLLAGLGTWWSAPDFKKNRRQIVQQSAPAGGLARCRRRRGVTHVPLRAIA